MDKFSVGVAGCGAIATERHIPAIKNSDQAQLRAVYDHKLPNAERAASRFDVPYEYADFDRFLDDVDVTTIATPPFVHRDLTVAALRSDTHVLCEKPFAVEKSDAEAMLEAAERYNARLGIVHNFLFADSVKKAKTRVQNGSVGEVQYVKGFQLSSPARGLPSWYADLPYDLFFDESPHLLYLMEEFIGSLTPTHVESQTADERLKSLSATFDGEDDRRGQLTMHFNAPLSEWYLFVIGTEQVLIVDVFRDILYAFGRERFHSSVEVLQTSLSAVMQILLGIARSGIRLLADDLYFGFADLFDRYLQAVRTGDEPPVTAADGYRIFDTMYEVIEYDERSISAAHRGSDSR
ncbi:Gfo/Idh/MocA family oxidoreductase [Halostella sp. JP-L12]|uniref:Gfo/Idh/MocA family protein n=1 Tax=Halostella TaxID=1843185 RepID=UPI000EF7E8D1|nr:MULTISPECIES: Gfo/Idh/MocA family oxidoreductase [Halostella]NHN46548.1 Gfo/Idh/MocA family oxidoreductase [Halostella sp. JP-L12]